MIADEWVLLLIPDPGLSLEMVEVDLALPGRLKAYQASLGGSIPLSPIKTTRGETVIIWCKLKRNKMSFLTLIFKVLPLGLVNGKNFHPRPENFLLSFLVIFRDFSVGNVQAGQDHIQTIPKNRQCRMDDEVDETFG